MTKEIQYYRVMQYGCEREFIHPANKGEAKLIQQLTGQKTIDGRVRELLRDLTGSGIVWKEVVAPCK